MLFKAEDENTLYISRHDVDEIFGSFSPHSFMLEEKDWPTVEHYFNAMKFTNSQYQEKIQRAPTPAKAQKLGANWLNRFFWQKQPDWKNRQIVYMTRAIYSKCKQHSHIAEALLATGDKRMVENSQYDYYWGCGRDRRGQNKYGEVLMNVRDKLAEEA